MAPGYRIAFWQNMPSPHQAAHLREVAAVPGLTVSVAFSGAIPQWRRDSGWGASDFTGVIVRSWRDAQACIEEPGWIHVFSGIRWCTPLRAAFERALGAGRTVGIMSETADWSGLRGAVRKAMGIADRMRFESRIAFVLAIGSPGVRWFRGLGYPDTKVFPYAYFVNAPPSRARASPGVCEIVFAGRLVEQKGVDLLLEALAIGDLPDWHLTVVGDGPERERLREIARRRSLEGRVTWLGAMAPDAAAAQIGAGDVLVLPSRRKEGWGVVVNEALLQGVSVICSDLCGAADLVRGERGEVVPAGNVIALARALERVLAGRGDDRDSIRSWANAAIDAGSGARYLRAVLDHALAGAPRPAPPWLLE